MKKPEYLLICTLFASFLLAPALARVAGIRAEAFENRALAERPRAGWASAFDTGYYAGVSAWMEDHLSLRQMAVSTDARLDLNLFRDSPDPQVWLGRNDWLYYDAGLRRACTGDTAPAALLESISRLETMLGESGRTLRWMIVPNKIAIYPEHATPGILRAASCGEARRGELYDALQNSPPSGFIDLHRVFKTAKEQFSRQLYFPDDSHAHSAPVSGIRVRCTVANHFRESAISRRCSSSAIRSPVKPGESPAPTSGLASRNPARSRLASPVAGSRPSDLTRP
jgi:hypothetical protein